MSLQQLKAEVAALSTQERRELLGYMVSLGRERTTEYWDRLASKIEDQDPKSWVAEDELDRVLGLDKPDA